MFKEDDGTLEERRRGRITCCDIAVDWKRQATVVRLLDERPLNWTRVDGR
jgi:hypothetical protein